MWKAAGWADLRGGLLGESSDGASSKRRGGRIVRVEVADSVGAPIGEDVGVRFVSLASLVAAYLVPPEHRRRLTERAGDATEHEDDEAWPPCTFTFGKREWWGSQWPADRKRIGFLAQYQLLEQIPELARDIGHVPYAEELGAGMRIRRNLWLGGAGATTALHFDPKDNLLCQIVGFKYVRLYAAAVTHLIPQETRMRRRMETEMLRSAGNFSLADVESPRLESEYPAFAAAPYTETILGPGDMLFIPWGCWHYCRSLTTSISLNVWWSRGVDDLRRVPHFGPLLEATGNLERTVASNRLY